MARRCQDLGIEKGLAAPNIGMMAGSKASMIYALVVEGRRVDGATHPTCRMR